MGNPVDMDLTVGVKDGRVVFYVTLDDVFGQRSASFMATVAEAQAFAAELSLMIAVADGRQKIGVITRR